MKKTVLKIVIAVIGQVIFTLYDLDAAGVQQQATTTSMIALTQEEYQDLLQYKFIYQYEKEQPSQDAISLKDANDRIESLYVENTNLKNSLTLLNSKNLEATSAKQVITPSLSCGLKYGLSSGFGGYLGASATLFEHWGGELSIAVSERDLCQVTAGLKYTF